MSEKRKRSAKIVAEFYGNGGKKKRVRIELFNSDVFPSKTIPQKKFGSRSYRVRLNGKWSQGHATFTLTTIMAQLRGLLARGMR